MSHSMSGDSDAMSHSMSGDSDAMSHSMVSHPGLHCLSICVTVSGHKRVSTTLSTGLCNKKYNLYQLSMTLSKMIR